MSEVTKNMFEVTILRSQRSWDKTWEYQGWCGRCHRHVSGERSGSVAASKATIQKWAKAHLEAHAYAEDYVERMKTYRYEVCGTIPCFPEGGAE